MFLNQMLGGDDSGPYFPAGMHVLLVDRNQACLQVLGNMLCRCRYNVTATTQSNSALGLLRKYRNCFDLLICDVNMQAMDGFRLLQQARLESNLPVVMLSEYNTDKEIVMESIIHGACHYLVKPVSFGDLWNIWQHVVRKDIDCSIQGIVSENKILGQKRKEQSDEKSSSANKGRLVWTNELHTHFLAAVNLLGLSKATPKRIHGLMNVEGLTRSNIASHLQKYKLSLTKPTKPPSWTSSLEFSGLNPPSSWNSFSSVVQNQTPNDMNMFQQNDIWQGGAAQLFDFASIPSQSEAQMTNTPAIPSTSTVAAPLQDAEAEKNEEDLFWDSIELPLGEDGLLTI